MNRLIPIFTIAAATLVAQQTRTEIVKASPNSADDSKPNSDKVPEAYAISGQFQRVVVLRFKFDTDLLAGMEKMVKQEKIKNGVILSGIGSVRGYHIHQVSNRTFPSKNIFVKDPTAHADIIGMNGYIIDGRIHPHMTLADAEKSFGGHLEPDTKVFTFAIITIGVLGDATDLSRIDDKTYR
ncbi:MAG TPA: PPC domain-containing DNA-binding protein [Bryobacteraceae bacterium]|nr:PPC domain-containing DNA-binding protein [Bryobacteraceae bacterium]